MARPVTAERRMSDLISIEQHRARVLEAVQRLPEELVPLADAYGLVLAQPVAARMPLPGFDNSAMDGYAVRRADVAAPATTVRIVADLPAGSALDPPLRPGEAARIMTGAPVPTDADAIVPLEDTELGVAIGADAPAVVTVLVPPRAGAHIRRVSEDAAVGTELVPAGTVLGPLQLSAAASAGHPTLTVVRAARVAVISTGSELVPPGTPPARGQVTESNSVLLGAAVREAGAVLTSTSTVADDEDALRTALAAACRDADAVILTGGVSVGAFDVVKAVLSRTGTVDFARVAMQPGKPQGFGTASDGTLLFCLPGNPVSVSVSFEMFVRPALKAAMGHDAIDRPRVTRSAATGWRTPAGRTQVMPAVVDDERVWPASAGGSGSHLVASLAAARAFAVVPAGVDRVDAGDPVTVMLLD
jgi:molybdenum cofactor synthesis domain